MNQSVPSAPLKRFLVFDYLEYYPSGGWCDFEGSYDTIEEARAHRGWRQIVDSTTSQVVEGEKP